MQLMYSDPEKNSNQNPKSVIKFAKRCSQSVSHPPRKSTKKFNGTDPENGSNQKQKKRISREVSSQSFDELILILFLSNDTPTATTVYVA